MNFNSSAYVLLFSVSGSRNPCFVPLLTPLGSTFNKRCWLVAAIALDALLQDYAYRAFVRPKTGVLYDLPNCTYLTPILGFLTYNASNLSAKNLSGLDLKSFGDPIRISFSDVESTPNGSAPIALVIFNDSSTPNECSTILHKNFSIVTESVPSLNPLSERKEKGRINNNKQDNSYARRISQGLGYGFKADTEGAQGSPERSSYLLQCWPCC
ncbi:hypothetical protein V6N11_009643 [Hibiscus sabdariffa]|uniref:Uncharacterized protein n=1 Tax=Hibiscus sabdariffa TaxID=183260 RepID=A0ABR2P5Z8_9ROSI